MNVWLGTENHGYTYVFSSQEKADMWMIKESEFILAYEDPERLDIAISRDGCVSVYYEGETVAKVEKVLVDEAS